jgi:ribosomal protein S18 acetylase RimI-like enzyme
MVTPRFTIRRARAADVNTIGRMGAVLLRVHYEFDHDRFMRPGAGAEEGYASFLLSRLADSDALVLVAEQDARVAGYLYAAIEPRSWQELRERAGYVHDVFVDEGHRSTGLADALMNAAFDWMRTQGLPRVLLSTAFANERAQRVFDRLGFRRTMIEMTKELK